MMSDRLESAFSNGGVGGVVIVIIIIIISIINCVKGKLQSSAAFRSTRHGHPARSPMGDCSSRNKESPQVK
jgi:hypothetical protein